MTETKAPAKDNVGVGASVVRAIKRIAHGDDAAGVGGDGFTGATLNFEPASKQCVSSVVCRGDLGRRADDEKGAHATVAVTRGQQVMEGVG